MGGEARNVVRMTISVPRDLKAKMDAARVSENWSALAAHAFRVKLLELESRKGVSNMKEVIERLRASKKKTSNEVYLAGLEAGRECARSGAETRDLEAIEKLRSDVLGTYDSLGAYIRGCAAMIDRRATGNSLSELVYFRIFQKRAVGGNVDSYLDVYLLLDPVVAASFWKNLLDVDADKLKNPDFMLGFLEGALELWDQVKDQVKDNL